MLSCIKTKVITMAWCHCCTSHTPTAISWTLPPTSTAPPSDLAVPPRSQCMILHLHMVSAVQEGISDWYPCFSAWLPVFSHKHLSDYILLFLLLLLLKPTFVYLRNIERQIQKKKKFHLLIHSLQFHNGQEAKIGNQELSPGLLQEWQVIKP